MGTLWLNRPCQNRLQHTCLRNTARSISFRQRGGSGGQTRKSHAGRSKKRKQPTVAARVSPRAVPAPAEDADSSPAAEIEHIDPEAEPDADDQLVEVYQPQPGPVLRNIFDAHIAVTLLERMTRRACLTCVQRSSCKLQPFALLYGEASLLYQSDMLSNT